MTKQLQLWLTKIAKLLAECKIKLIKNILIELFIKHYSVNMNDYRLKDKNDFACFKDFFTRQFRQDARPIDKTANRIVSPVDGQISQFGRIESNRLLQAKGIYYSLKDLLAGDNSLTQLFSNGSFMTLYLSPSDYHRVHMPFAGHLDNMLYVPGTLFAVNQNAQLKKTDLFTRNERVINVFSTSIGKMCVILVGACLVGSIETQWHGDVTCNHRHSSKEWDYTHQAIDMQKGEEIGLFNMGSTVIILFEKHTVQWLPALSKRKKYSWVKLLDNISSDTPHR
jgi:phosphatidylserine decarboxylase